LKNRAGEIDALQEFPEATIATLIAQHVAAQPESPAIVMSKGSGLTYGALGEQIKILGAGLCANGIGRCARVAIMLPDGPELAVGIVGAACHAVAVPINPKLIANELDSLFARLRIDAIVTSTRIESAAADVAARRGIPLLDFARGVPRTLKVPTESAVTSAPYPSELIPEGVALPDALALILCTSATTGRPKLVPVTHRNLVTAAARRRFWFNLTPADRALCTMPLHYSQGLKGELFPSLLIGGSVACPDRDSDADIVDWLAELQPTWYAGAGQTFHMTVLERALTRQGALRHCLRFIRSGGAPLSAALRKRLEEVFGVPVLETYSLSETGTVAANSIKPEDRKSGTVGRPWPNEVAIRAEDGQLLPPGESGEIVVRGPGLMPGYIDDDEANRAAFVDGWFRTGDVGLIDTQGFLTISGRLKEYINRGGEKISPYEIEGALLLHPSVREAVAFSVPHPRLGENVAAAVVLMPGVNTTSKEIRTFLSQHLAPFKIPRRVLVQTALPKGVTGKLLRLKLSEAAADRIQNVVPAWSPLQVLILEIWQRLLGRSDIGIDDDFFEAGGDSLLSIQMICEVEAIARQQIPTSALRDVYTVRELDAAVMRGVPTTEELVTCAKNGHGTPFFFCHGDFQSRGLYALNMADRLTCKQPVFLLHPHINPDPKLTIEDMARAYIPDILAVQPTGALQLGGACNGGYIAWEIARQLNALGRQVEFVVLFETASLNARPTLRAIAKLTRFVVSVAPKKISEKFERDAMSAVWSRLWHRYPVTPYSHATRKYVPAKLETRLIWVLSEESRAKAEYSATPWAKLASQVHCEYIAGTHMIHIVEIALLLDGLLKQSHAVQEKDPLGGETASRRSFFLRSMIKK
jgi:acyl-CoA synthetase (AMP-forming)/AMP-acid ligase II/thioesterase domain-containing protein